MKKVVSSPNAPAAIGPYSPAIQVGSFLFASGQLGINPADATLPDSVEEQAHQAFRNIAALLKAAGSDLSSVVKTTVFVRSMDDFAAINDIYAQYFSQPYPARSCVEAARLPKNALVEIECIACLEKHAD